MHIAGKHAENPPMQMQFCVGIVGTDEKKPRPDAACAGRYIEGGTSLPVLEEGKWGLESARSRVLQTASGGLCPEKYR